MIRVLIELWPGGDVDDSSLLGEVAIANVTPYEDPASYVAAVVDSSGDLVRSHVVRGHRRSDGWAALVSRALDPATIDNSGEIELLTSAIAAHLSRGG